MTSRSSDCISGLLLRICAGSCSRRKQNVQQENLLREYGVRYISYRTKEGKALSLRWDGVR